MDRATETENAQDRDTGEPVTSEPIQETVIPVVAEELVAGTKAVKTGAVRVHKRVQEHVEHIDMPLIHDAVEVRRVVVNRVVDAAPRVRTEGDTIIVPVLEEQIVVTKRLVLKEELHLIKRRTKTRSSQEVTVRREEAEVVRVDAEGNEKSVRPARAGAVSPQLARRRNKIIPED